MLGKHSHGESVVNAVTKSKKRRMVEHYRGDGAEVILGWRCSDCRWSYDAKRAFGKYDLPDDVRKRAEQKFVEHICAE
jgi:hypothetical protein